MQVIVLPLILLSVFLQTAAESCDSDMVKLTERLNINKSTIPTVALSNGVLMPKLAAGTCFRDVTKDDARPSSLPNNPRFFGFLPERTYRSINLALELGYTHIDTALVYRSQKALGSVLASKFMSGELRREDVFITTKLFHGPMAGLTRRGTTLPLDDMSPEEVAAAVEEQFELVLEELGVGYVDLMLMHWPAVMESKDEGNAARRIAAWRVFETMLSRGWARAIGVSNFSEHHIERLVVDGATVLPMVNQIEASAYKQFDGIVDYCRERGIALMAYSPLGLGKESLLNDPVILAVARKHSVNPAQVALRYLIQLGYAVLPLSTSEERLKMNMEIFSFDLDGDDMEKLKMLKAKDEGIGLPSPYSMS